MDAGDIGGGFDEVCPGGSQSGNANTDGVDRGYGLKFRDQTCERLQKSIEIVDDRWSSPRGANLTGRIHQARFNIGSTNVNSDVTHQGFSMGYSGRPDKGDFNECKTD